MLHCVQPLIKSPFAEGIDGCLLISDSDVFGALLLTILLVSLQALALQVAEPCSGHAILPEQPEQVARRVLDHLVGRNHREKEPPR